MPLEKGSSKKVLAANFHELRHGKTFKHTEEKFGKKKAEKQMIAINLSNQRKSEGGKRSGKAKR